MPPVHVAKKLFRFNVVKIQRKSRSSSHFYKRIKENVSKDFMLCIKWRGFTSPSFFNTHNVEVM